MSTLQQSARDLFARHQIAGLFVMFCVTFTIISLVLQGLHFVGFFPDTEDATFGHRVGLAAFCAVISFIAARSARVRDAL